MSALPSVEVSLAAIATRLGSKRPLLLIDLETTGTSVQNDRIVEIAIAKWTPKTAEFDYGMMGQPIDTDVPASVVTKVRRINPGISIPKSATAVHGIGDADVAGLPSFGAVASSLSETLAGCDLVGYNLRSYDLPLLLAEFARCGKPFSIEGASIIDAKEVFFRREPRDLTAAVKMYCGEDFDGAHAALADIGATAAVLIGQIDRYTDMPSTVPELAAYCLNRAPESLTDCGRIAWRDGAARLTFSKNAGMSLAEVDPGFLRWIMANDFPSDVKAVCRDALNGKTPTKPDGIE